LVDVAGPSPAVLAAVGDTRCVVAAGAGAGLRAAGKRVLLSGVEAGRSVFLLDGQSAYRILMCSLLDESVE